jgi:hypothetical protein
MPHPTRRTPRPRRAEPLQPDQPTRGDEVVHETPQPDDADAREQRREQSDTALDNVREGYRGRAA